MTSRVGSRLAVLATPGALALYAMPLVPRALLSPGQRRALAALPDAPGPVFSFGGFECRLSADERVDFIAFALDEDGGRRACDSVESDHPLGPLLGAWRDSAHDTCGICLEWDQLPGPSWRPFAFLRVAEDGVAGRWSTPRMERWLERWLPLLVDGVAVEVARAELLQANVSLPPEGRLLHIAPLERRGSSAVRVHVVLPKRDLPRYLRSMDWGGPDRDLDSLLRAWNGVPDPIGIQFDVGATPFTQLDLELHVPTAPLDDPHWKAALDWIRERVPCPPDKLAAALEWHDAVPLASGRRVLLRWSFLKVRLRPDRVEAKAYLGFSARAVSA